MSPIFGTAMTIYPIPYSCFPLVPTYTTTPPNLFSTFGEERFWL